MSKDKLFLNFIESLEKSDFDKFVIKYLNIAENYFYVINTDGKDDLGMDLKVIDLKGEKIQFQVTIQKKGFEKKLEEDLVKANRNVEEFEYSNTLKFFYSQKLTNKKIEYLRLLARKNYSISLEIYDANRLAGITSLIEELQVFLLNQNEIGELIDDSILTKDPTINAIHDLLTLGNGANLKLELLKSFIGNLIFENSGLSFHKIKENVENHFTQSVDEKFIANTIQKLITQKKVKRIEGLYELTEKEKNRVKISRNLLSFRKKQFYRKVNEILVDNAVKDNKSKIQNAIINFFKKHYSNQAKEYKTHDSDLIFREISDDLLTVLKEHTDEKTAIKIIEQLFTELSQNNFIQKVCAVSSYAESVNLDYLENHLSNIHRNVYLDTQILLQAACYSYLPKTNYNDYFFRETRALIKYGANQNISFYTSKYYFNELKNQAKMAFNLIPFTKLDFFDTLGTTQNIFFNFYSHLTNSGETDLSYEEFIKDIGFDFSGKDKTINDEITLLLSSIGINISYFEKHYHIERTKDLISDVLISKNKSKTSFALSNDSIMFEFLSDTSTDIHQTTPIFITWDMILYLARPKFYEQNPLLNRWFMFTPAKFIDHYSITQLVLGESNITDEMIAFLENRFTTETYNLIDSINAILDLSNQVGVKYAKALGEIRDKEIYNKDFLPKTQIDENIIVPVDFVVHKINSFYSIDNDIFERFKKIFTVEDFLDDIKDIIKESIEKLKTNKEFYEGTLQRIDLLMKQV